MFFFWILRFGRRDRKCATVVASTLVTSLNAAEYCPLSLDHDKDDSFLITVGLSLLSTWNSLVSLSEILKSSATG